MPKMPDPFDVDGFIAESADALQRKQEAERTPSGNGLAAEIRRVSAEQAARERRDRINNPKLKLNE